MTAWISSPDVTYMPSHILGLVRFQTVVELALFKRLEGIPKDDPNQILWRDMYVDVEVSIIINIFSATGYRVVDSFVATTPGTGLVAYTWVMHCSQELIKLPLPNEKMRQYEGLIPVPLSPSSSTSSSSSETDNVPSVKSQCQDGTTAQSKGSVPILSEGRTCATFGPDRPDRIENSDRASSEAPETVVSESSPANYKSAKSALTRSSVTRTDRRSTSDNDEVHEISPRVAKSIGFQELSDLKGLCDCITRKLRGSSSRISSEFLDRRKISTTGLSEEAETKIANSSKASSKPCIIRAGEDSETGVSESSPANYKSAKSALTRSSSVSRTDRRSTSDNDEVHEISPRVAKSIRFQELPDLKGLCDCITRTLSGTSSKISSEFLDRRKILTPALSEEAETKIANSSKDSAKPSITRAGDLSRSETTKSKLIASQSSLAMKTSRSSAERTKIETESTPPAIPITTGVDTVPPSHSISKRSSVRSSTSSHPEGSSRSPCKAIRPDPECIELVRPKGPLTGRNSKSALLEPALSLMSKAKYSASFDKRNRRTAAALKNYPSSSSGSESSTDGPPSTRPERHKKS